MELVKSGGWMMLPIILSSIAAMAIVAERLWTLRASRVTPEHLLGQVWVWIKDKQLNKEKLKELRASSPLGEILAAGLANSKHGREIMKECIEEAAARVIHELERYINALGTIAAMAPLLGLLGTVLGMIDIFSAFMGTGMTTNASVLAGGISKALITTAAGLMVGIPSVFFHRFLQRRIDELVVGMEQEAIKLVEVVQGDRDVDLAGSKSVKFRRKQRENVDINLASLIDVVFILLLFFVVTTTFTRETQLRVELPEAVSGASADDQTRQLDVAISADGVFSVNNRILPKSDLATLMEALQKESNGDTKMPLSISADGKSQHQSVITAMDAAGKLGFSHLRMTTVEAAPTAPLMAMSDRLLAAWYTGHPALKLLQPLEWLYRRVVNNKRKRFLAGEGDIYQPPVPLIVVGNITVGGTGKTPLILWMIEHCQRSGLRVGVVSRGYGAKPPHLPWRVEAEHSAEIAGDEPLLIVQRTGVPLMIDPDRSSAVKALLASEPLDLILSDDGMQHYRLARDLELVLIDAARGLGNRRCLPAGPLREPVERLQSVDAVLYNGATTDRDDGFAFQLQPTALVNLKSGERRPLDHFPAGQALHAVAGIGNPQRFFKTLETLHWQPVPHAFADHAEYSVQALNFTPSLPLVMTEKDAVKCRAFAAADWWYLAVDAVPSPAFVAWFDTQLMRLLPARLLP